jgi:hypothetical protein
MTGGIYGSVYSREGNGVKAVGYITQADVDVVWVCNEIRYDGEKFVLHRTIYDEVNEKLDQMTIATYGGDDCAKASFNSLYAEPRYKDFKALWVYLLARAQEAAKS